MTISALFGCGGGGGGAPPADLRGVIKMLPGGGVVSGATVTAGGTSVVTDVNGAFDFPSIGSDSTTLTVTASGAKALTQTLPTLAALPAVNDIGDVFLVDTAGSYAADVDGVIIRADTKAVISGATVLLSGHKATTPANGTFSFTGLPVGLGGTFPVGLVKATTFEDKPIQFDIVLGTSPPTNHLGNIEMVPPVGGIPGGPVDITGKISLQGLTDLSGTTVELHKKSDGSLLGSVTTGADGKYGFWVIAGQYTVVAKHTAFTTKQQDVIVTSTAVVQTVNLTLVP